MSGFQRIATAALVSVTILIFVGAIVRVTGSGLGCPDWPKCWGCYIPPTSIEEVNMTDEAYERIRAKAIRLGRPENEVTREALLEEFNPVHTWIEYINRLTSLPVGLFAAITFFWSLAHWKRRPQVAGFALLALLNILFNAWLGMQVVYSGLKPGIITLHMALAFTLIVMQVYIAWRGTDRPWRLPFPQAKRRTALRLGYLVLGLVLIEGIMGSQVRELTDVLAKSHIGEDRASWTPEIEQSFVYLAHRSFAWVIVAATAALYFYNRRARGRSHKLENAIAAIVLSMMLMGIVLAHISINPVVQVLHVGLTAVLIALLTLYLLALRAPKPATNPDFGT